MNDQNTTNLPLATVLLPDHTEIQGLARWIEKDLLVRDIRKSSSAKVHPKGLASVPRDQISTIDMHLRHPRDRGDEEGERMGVLLGTFAAIPAGLAVGSNESLPGWLGWVVFGVAIAGGAFLGHLLTRHSDGQIVIQVIPKPVAHGPILKPRRELPASELP